MPRRDYDSDLDDEPRRRRRRKPPKKRGLSPLVIVLLVALPIVLIGGGAAALFFVKYKGAGLGGSVAGDYDRLAGRWECTFRDPVGRVTMHKVKEITGRTETATWYQPDGRVFRVNRVEFELVQRGPTKNFRYFNGWATDAFGVGQPFPSGEYAYTLEGDTWTEYVPGGDNIVWTRVR
jgi:hypothetical protein